MFPTLVMFQVMKCYLLRYCVCVGRGSAGVKRKVSRDTWHCIYLFSHICEPCTYSYRAAGFVKHQCVSGGWQFSTASLTPLSKQHFLSWLTYIYIALSTAILNDLPVITFLPVVIACSHKGNNLLAKHYWSTTCRNISMLISCSITTYNGHNIFNLT